MFATHTRSTLLGAILTVGMTPFGFAADAPISLDVCDALGLLRPHHIVGHHVPADFGRRELPLRLG